MGKAAVGRDLAERPRYGAAFPWRQTEQRFQHSLKFLFGGNRLQAKLLFSLPSDLMGAPLQEQGARQGGKDLGHRIRRFGIRASCGFQQEQHLVHHGQTEFPHHQAVGLLRQLPVDFPQSVSGDIFADGKGLSRIVAGAVGGIDIAVRQGCGAVPEQDLRLKQSGKHVEFRVVSAALLPPRKSEQVIDRDLRRLHADRSAVRAVQAKCRFAGFLRQQR